MNQSIRDNTNKMMPVPYTLSETHQGFPTSSPCSSQDFDSKILSGQKLRLPNPFWCPGLFSLCNDTWCCKEAQTGYPALPGECINVWTALIYTLVYSHHPAPRALLEVVQLVGKTIRV